MESTTTPEIAKKLSNMLRLMKKRGKILGKSVNDFMLRHHTTLDSVRCRSLDDVHVSFVYPMEYEFSCSSSPPHHQRSRTPGHLSSSKRNNTNYYNGRYHHQHSRRSVYVPMMCEDVLGNKNVSFCGGDVVEPLRRRPRVRKVRITEWEPLFPLNTSEEEEEEEWHVDKAAQEFIDKFYRDLMLQKWNSVADRCF